MNRSTVLSFVAFAPVLVLLAACNSGGSNARGCGCSSGGGGYRPPPAPTYSAPAYRPAPPVASAISNTICPVMGNPVDPSVPTSQYQGRTIGFCCGGCKPRFDANPAAYAVNIR